MPIWVYVVIGLVIVLLVLLTFRRNVPVTHSAATAYDADFRSIAASVEPGLEALRQAIRAGAEQDVSRAAIDARSRVHAAINSLDRLEVRATVGESAELIEEVKTELRRAMECYEWGARIAESTEFLENAGLRRAFETLTAQGDQLNTQARVDLAGVGVGA